MRKVLLLAPGLETSDIAPQVRLLATGLPRGDFDVRVCSFDRPGPVAEALGAAGVTVETLDRRHRWDWQPIGRLRRVVGAFRPDIVQSWRKSGLRAARLAGSAAGRPLVVSTGLRPAESRGWLDWLDRRLLRRADRVVASDEAEAQRLRRAGVAASRIAVIPTGSAEGAATATAPPLSFRPPWPGGARLIVCVGPLQPEQGFRDAIWAFDILKYLYADVHLVILGDGPERQSLEAFAAALRARDRVHLVGYPSDPAAVLARSLAVWVPSRADSGADAALQAMAHGRPVVATRVPGLAEVVADGASGYLVAPGDRAGIARQTRLLLEDPERRTRMGEAGRRRLETHFGAAGLVEAYRRLYDTLDAEP